jgi:hypothetical protein
MRMNVYYGFPIGRPVNAGFSFLEKMDGGVGLSRLCLLQYVWMHMYGRSKVKG